MASTPSSVLIVDDDPAVGRVLQALLKQAGIASEYVASGSAALEVLARRPHDAVVVDLYMEEMDGLDLLQWVRAQWPELPVVMMSGQGTVALAVEAMKRGASDFVLKPCDRDEVLFAVQKALASGRAAAERPPSVPTVPGAFVGTSAAMREVDVLLTRAAQGTATVLLRGESGTGKELAARAIHARSPRCAGPFVVLGSCGARAEAPSWPWLGSDRRGDDAGAEAVARGYVVPVPDPRPAGRGALLRVAA